ncbi:nucleoside triphosphate pyrophosphohydrolase [Chloracidobacterium sp. MS 40/45]|uniref:nucleoside triphosphate pyrophosphohydrolase n=1 Tax=Chloracidobacterium aggregatum TaxID=2851959 RepID=UPI001B8D5ED9|nr:nucleoside triphosphate pyrophosphohydrolase [Chloracidobacterium aggregatum]QUW00909.1 nucleoside triphosphate pyrophosphohydrolase [Chloracidobacterium sp. MS 40/45]
MASSRTFPDNPGPEQRFQALVEVMARLRGPQGCPWDREQTHQTLKPYLLEEAYEVLHALDEGDDRELCRELGDILLQVVFHAQIAAEEGRFDIYAVIDALREKLIRRHPHVFGNVTVQDAQEVTRNWEAIKAQEKAQEKSAASQDGRPASVLDGVSPRMPALIEARQLTERAAYYDFDWPDARAVLAKLEEETGELQAVLAQPAPNPQEIAEEVGDLLFVVVNLARKLGLDPEATLKATNQKFRRRFAAVEQVLAARGKTLAESDPAEMNAIWDAIKHAPASSSESHGG